jgi:hypothetical protein
LFVVVQASGSSLWIVFIYKAITVIVFAIAGFWSGLDFSNTGSPTSIGATDCLSIFADTATSCVDWTIVATKFQPWFALSSWWFWFDDVWDAWIGARGVGIGWFGSNPRIEQDLIG